MKDQFVTLKLSELTPGEAVGFVNPREKMDASGVRQLADDIKEKGLLNPLQVWPTVKDDEPVYVLIGGFRRKAAIELLLKEDAANGFDKGVPVRLVEGESLLHAKYNALADNIQREELSSFELAQEMARLKEMGETGRDIAERLHKSETWVSRKLSSFAAAGKALRAAWKARKLSDDNVEDLAKIEDEEEQEKLVEQLVRARANGRKGKGKARAKARRRAGKIQKAGAKEMQEYVILTEEAPKDLRYVRGMHDAFSFAIGGIEADGFDKEWKSWFKERQKAAEAEAKAAAEDAKEWAGKGKE